MSKRPEEGSEILRPLSDEELEELLDLYRVKCGDESFEYLLIYTQCKWNKKLKQMQVAADDKRWISFRKPFYTHRDGDFRLYGTYVCLHQDLMQSVAFHSWQENFSEMLECLSKTKMIDWKSGPLLINVPGTFSQEVKALALAKGCTIQRARLCHGVILSHQQALELNIPSLPLGYKLAELSVNHAELIHSRWANKKEGSLDFVKGLITINGSIGIYEEETSQLVGWIFQNDFSGLGILEVMPSAQRKGFGTILTMTMSKLIAESEKVNLSAWFVIENAKSEALLQKVGYRKTVLYEWIQLNKIE